MKERWLALREKVAELAPRERVILAVTAVVVVLVIWLQFVFTPYESRAQRISQANTQAVNEISEFAERVVSLNNALENDPNAPLRAEQQRLQASMQELREDIEGRLSSLIAPEKMADVMRSVLSNYHGLKLKSARNLPVEPLQLGTENAAMDKTRQNSKKREEAAEAVVFAHGFEMVLEGQYFQTLEFLRRLETMEGFYWRLLDYEVESYPKARITLQLSTLSLEEDWIGV